MPRLSIDLIGQVSYICLSMTEVKNAFLKTVAAIVGEPERIGDGQSLYSLRGDSARLYIRYSKVHGRGSCFYGLRDKDLALLEGHNSFICLLWEGQPAPLLLPYDAFHDVFQAVPPAMDGQFKVQVHLKSDGTDFYVARAGRFSVDGYYGLEELSKAVESKEDEPEPCFSHGQIQTLLGAIGDKKQYDVWIPTNDHGGLDWSLSSRFLIVPSLPNAFREIAPLLSQIDVIWIEKGSVRLRALYEIEHSTPIYSGLLRFNDILLTTGLTVNRFAIVSNEKRRSLFTQQVNRPTFRRSGLSETCTFLEYTNVYRWYRREFGLGPRS